MNRTRIFFICAASSASAVMVIAACGGEERRDFGMADGSPDAEQRDGAPSIDAGGRPDADARAPFDPTEVEVTCSAKPCAVQLVAGDAHFCVRMSDGTARCWGSDNLGALGGATGERPEDSGADAGWIVGAVPNLAGVVELRAAGSTTCVRLEEGGISCWGSNELGQLGLSADPNAFDLDPHPEPAPVVLPPNVAPVRVDVGHRSACIVTSSKETVCWGSNEQLQLARPTTEPVLPAARAELGSLAVVRSIPAAHTTFGLTASGEVWSWGAVGAPFGTIGGRVGSVSPDPLPGKIGSLTNVTSFAISAWIEDLDAPEPVLPHAHACAIASGEVYCWGQTYRGALCTGVPDSSRTPAHAPTYAEAWPQEIAVSDELTCVRMTDGTVQCCGEDGHGRLGRGAVQLATSSFVPATAFTGTAVHIATSNGAVCALVQGGTVECWGSNEHGELGQGGVDERDHPSPVPVRF